MLLDGSRLDVVRCLYVVLQEVGHWHIRECSNRRQHTVALRVDCDVVVLVEVDSSHRRAEQFRLALRVTQLNRTRWRTSRIMRARWHEGSGVTVEVERLLQLLAWLRV